MDKIFQSTRPMRGATLGASFCGKDTRFQSTRPMRGATAMYVDIHAPRRKFQSTRPMRGATPLPPQPKTAKMRFQSTRPMRGATTCKVLQAFAWDISIHAPHAGRDIRAINHVVYKFDFNPRAPCGARPPLQTFPRRAPYISIHAPHAGRDGGCKSAYTRRSYFNPRAPCGARRCATMSWNAMLTHFNPRAPCGARLGKHQAQF